MKLRKEYVCCGVILFLEILLVFISVGNHKNYMDLLSVNEQLLEDIELERDRTLSLKNSYYDLQDRHDELLFNYDRAIERLDETDIPIYDFTEAEIELIALCAEAEAGYSAESQKYVVQVILNRLHSSDFPNGIDEVIYQKVDGLPQFSVSCNGMMNREVNTETLMNVYSAIVHGTDLPSYVKYFYAKGVTENWVNTLEVYTEVDGTVFAYDKKEVNE